MNLIITKKVVATFTSVATVAMLTAGAFLPMAAGAASFCGFGYLRSWNLPGGMGGIGVGADGNVITTDPWTGTVYRYTSTGTPIDQWQGGFGNSLWHGVIDSNGNIFVGNGANNPDYVVKFDSSGQYVTHWKAEPWQYGAADGLAVGSNGDVYVRTRSGTIRVYDNNGSFLREWGGVGYSSGINQVAVAKDAGGNDIIYVLDGAYGSSNTVRVFTPTGTLVKTYDFSLYPGWITGLAVSSDGSVFISQPDQNAITQFDADGNYVNSLTNAGTGPGQLNRPYFIAFGPDGNLYEADWGGASRKVQVFSCLPPPGSQPTLSIDSITQDGGTNLEANVTLNDSDGDPLSGDITISCTNPGAVNVTLSSANGFKDPVAGEPGAIYRPNLPGWPNAPGVGVGLISDPAGTFEYACGKCSASSVFLASDNPLQPRDCSLAGNAQGMIQKDICARSVSSGKMYTLDVTMYDRQIADPNASYIRTQGFTLTTPYSGLTSPYTLPGPIALTGAVSGATCTLTITSSDGNWPKITKSAPFTLSTETRLTFGTPPPTICQAKPGKACICHYDAAGKTEVLEVSVNAVKAHMKHGDDMFSELTQTCEVSIAKAQGSSTGSLLALAAAALAAGLGIGIYARRKK